MYNQSHQWNRKSVKGKKYLRASCYWDYIRKDYSFLRHDPVDEAMESSLVPGLPTLCHNHFLSFAPAQFYFSSTITFLCSGTVKDVGHKLVYWTMTHSPASIPCFAAYTSILQCVWRSMSEMYWSGGWAEGKGVFFRIMFFPLNFFYLIC